jgi:hypothetical protein
MDECVNRTLNNYIEKEAYLQVTGVKAPMRLVPLQRDGTSYQPPSLTVFAPPDTVHV